MKTARPLRSEAEERRDKVLQAYLVHGTTTKTAEETGIAQRTVHRIISAPANQARIQKLRGEVGKEFAENCLRVARRFLESVEASVNDPETSARDKAIILGVLVDKARVLMGKGDEMPEGEVVVTVRRGGARVRAAETPDGLAVEIEAAK